MYGLVYSIERVPFTTYIIKARILININNIKHPLPNLKGHSLLYTLFVQSCCRLIVIIKMSLTSSTLPSVSKLCLQAQSECMGYIDRK